jgi:NADPH:quinone reductase-like Zn-dependent oxidoreductase
MRALKRVAWVIAGAISLALVALLIGYWTSSNTCYDRKTVPQGALMEAIVYCDYGSPDVLKIQNIEKPTPEDDQLLVRVRAASVNPLDWHYMRGTPYFMRMGAGLRRPKVTRLGVDFAGTVEAVGKNVQRFKPGDEVFGGRTGAFAEYVTVREDRAVVLKPATLTFEQAASVPVAAGGVGTFAVQIAKSFGAEVTGVCSTRNLDMVRSIGADRVVDYTKEDFTKSAERYDLILDMVGNRSFSEYRRVMNPKGKYIMVGGPPGRWIDPLPRALSAFVLSRFVSQDVGIFVAQLNKQDLNMLGDLMQAGKVKPVIDRQYKLSEVPKAIGYVEEGHARGKVVIAVE